MLLHYNQRRDLLHRELRTHLGSLQDVHVPEDRKHLVGWLPPDKDVRVSLLVGSMIFLSRKVSYDS